jgi:hypothetical protein
VLGIGNDSKFGKHQEVLSVLQELPRNPAVAQYSLALPQGE